MSSDLWEVGWGSTHTEHASTSLGSRLHNAHDTPKFVITPVGHPPASYHPSRTHVCSFDRVNIQVDVVFMNLPA